jgi:hypothetical protein
MQTPIAPVLVHPAGPAKILSPRLLLEWMAFLKGSEDLAARDAGARGQPFHRCPDDLMRATAEYVTAHGLRPQATTTVPLSALLGAEV